MKIANIGGRAHIVTATGGVDIEQASDGRFTSDNQRLIAQLDELQLWYAENDPIEDPSLSTDHLVRTLERLQSPVPYPSQVFAIGLNYKAHGAEVAMATPQEPMIFTKFQSSISGPGATVTLPSNTVDWEVEMVVVIGQGGRNISQDDALRHVAGYCVGQDISERTLQLACKPPQFSIAKSYAAFAPMGPWLTTADSLDVSSLRLTCKVGDETLQDGNTKDMIFDVPTLISYISSICELRIGDILFTGTPDGVGMGRKPPMYIEDGWVLESSIEGLGTIINPCRRI
ncbi:fumarylacetoacetate hydrolase [Blastopirellula marina]|uniref:Fumarylacetoacetate hydrolase n=1 Tax=Blastopirellula marina TaxID=124 RepID=A0A2S8F0C2_9BACT|nr:MULTISPECIES: fumarylacetoacetate hydrolase family protein [Pirellulaceae]PQO25606.1 fumarylacetoacetate hydrolase [Blastopirellula marina]RCS43289.1 FAA hydrolase family protein [Bremerella cremea]